MFRSKVFWILGLSCVLFQLAIAWILKDVATPREIIVHQTTLSPEVFQSILDAWGPVRRERFLWHYALDFIFPLFYSTFLYILMRKLRMKGAWIALVAGGMDEVENIIQMQIVLGWMSLESPLFYIGAGAAIVKWLLLTIVMLLLLWRATVHLAIKNRS